MTGDRRPLLLVSECLLGRPVRYDGRHKRDPAVADELAREFELIPVCPEVDCGLPVPRPAMELRGTQDAPRMVVICTGEDVTDRMDAWVHRRLDELASLGVAGIVLKGRSPSCGPWEVPRLGPDGVLHRDGVGTFARAAAARWPDLPLAEAEALSDPSRRRAFVEATHAVHRTALARASGGSRPPGR